MVEYDPAVISEFADRLYSRASSLIVIYTVVGLGVGGGAGFGIDYALKLGNWVWWVAGGVVGLVGFLTGQEKAFVLKLEAQRALCQLKIEENTRPPAAVERSAA